MGGELGRKGISKRLREEHIRREMYTDLEAKKERYQVTNNKPRDQMLEA